MAQYINKLPAVFQTVTEKKFFDATFDQVFSKKDSDYLAGYIGRRNPGSYNPITDFYLPEPSKNRTWWQLEATAFARNADTTRSNVFFYDDLLDHIEYYGGNTKNQDRLFNSEYYSFAPPIDYDMFINYHNYYWVEQRLPVIEISGVLSTDIIGQTTYTTPNTATPPNLTLSTGMSIVLLDDPDYLEPHTVEFFSECDGIQLVPEFSDFIAGTLFEFLPWDGSVELSNGRVIVNNHWDIITWDTQPQPQAGDYITIQRGSIDQNGWSRTNKWYHIDTITATLSVTGNAFPSNATRALRPIIQFIANLELFNSGTQFNTEINYGFNNNQFNQPILFASTQGMNVSDINSMYSIDLSAGDLVCFFADTTEIDINIYPWDTFDWDTILWDEVDFSTTVNSFIFETTIDIDGNVTFVPYTSWNTPVSNGDIVRALEDAPFNGAQQGESWYYENGVWSQVYNDKVAINQPPLFQLFDHNGVPLDDESTYPNNSFNGNKIFSYKVNQEPGAYVDPVLRFPIVYTGLGQSSDIVFQNNLIVDRYTYNNNTTDIDGYYYFKEINEVELFNSWDLYNPCDCNDIVPPPPCNCVDLSKQRVIDKFVIGYGAEYQCKLSITPFGYTIGGPSIQDTADIIVSVNGVEVKNASAQTNGYIFQEINNRVYVNLEDYLSALLVTPQSQAVVVEIQTYTHDLLGDAELGYFQIPQQLEANPLQEEITEISGSNLYQHFSSIIGSQLGFSGVAFGGPNNYRDTRKNRSTGQFILQNVTPLLKSMLVSSSDDLSFINGLRFSQDEYTKFKNRYLQTALNLINQGFSPVQYYNNSVEISLWVEEILKTVNISKEFSSAFAYSYMIASGSPYATETAIVPLSGPISLTTFIDLSDSRNSLYIYDVTGQEKLLTIGVDYEIVSTNLSIEIEFTSNVTPGNDVYIAFYKNPLPAYIPSTPSKIGAYSVYIPRIEWDATYVDPTWVIIGHDGSKTIAYGDYDPNTGIFTDYRDALLLELETRIYNLVQYRFRHEYSLPLRLENVKSGYFRNTRYTREEYFEITESYINKWAAKNRANYRVNDWDTTSLTTPVNKLWKLYNYRIAEDSLGNPLNLPGNWKGIFQYMYDTYNPDTRPWEMLGFSIKPEWWEYEYGLPVLNSEGQEVWTSTSSGNNNLWADLEAGIIRQGPSAVYDPITGLPVPNELWARPGLSSFIPVDSSGEIISVMTLFDVVYSGNPYEPFDGYDLGWVYGDGAPVEQAWMSTSAYTFSIQEFLFLMRPAAYGELMWDTLGTEVSPGMITVPESLEPVRSNLNWQYVQNNIYTDANPFFEWMRPKNSTQIVHAEQTDTVVNIRYGYQRWISDRILFLGKNITETFGQKVRTLDVNLANKFAGFTNKDTSSTYIESLTPGSTTTGLLIPTNNFEVILHKSPVVETYSYSGIIIRALGDGTFIVYGYDLLNSEFTVLDRSDEKIVDITVGGTPAEFQYFNIGATYREGDIVRYNGVYYVSLVTQTVQKFEQDAWQRLKALPIVGGISVKHRPIAKETTTKIPYGSVLKNVQEVFDLLIGWGDYLESRGWKFDEVNPDTNTVSNWFASAKQFLFWLNSDWAPDASIQLSPLANKATLVASRGYPNNVETISNGVYSILDKFGVTISPQDTTTERDGRMISVSPSNLAAGGIYYLQINVAETEHILIFDNKTSFNDTIYSPLLRERQQRIRFNGFRSNNWYGKLEAPGYLVIDNQLVPNYDTIVNDMRYYYDPNVTIDNPSLEDLGRHLIGYESKSYLDNLELSNDIQYLFYKGMIRQKGTQQALDKLFRSIKIQSDDTIEVFEEWALKLGDFGNTVEQVSTEFILEPEQNTGEVIVSRLNYKPSTAGFIKQINILNAETRYTSVPSIVIGAPDMSPSDPALDGELPRQATAYAVLDSLGIISRIDITEPGFGYSAAPPVTVFAPSISNNPDRLYSVWQGNIRRDENLDNIIDIDIDETDIWVVRPTDPELSLQFPTTNKIDYNIPNAGYVNFNDVNYSSFDVEQTTVNWGSSGFNPEENNTVWVAKTFTEDWDVYKLVNTNQPFDVVAEADGNLYLRTDDAYLIQSQGTGGTNRTDFGNIIVLQVDEEQATGETTVTPPTVQATGTLTVSLGVITGVVMTNNGLNYTEQPLVTVVTNTGTGAELEAVWNNITGQITSINVLSGGTSYSITDTIVISAPPPSGLGEIVSAEITNAGSGYDKVPTVTITGTGTGAEIRANILNGEIISLDVVSQGTGYDHSTTISISAPTYTKPTVNYAIGINYAYTENGYNYYNLVNLAGENLTPTEIGDFDKLNRLILLRSMRFFDYASAIAASYVDNGDKFWVDYNVDNKWAVYIKDTTPALFREQEKLINSSLFQSASIFSTNSGNKLALLPVYDPFKGILPAPAKQNISYMTENDPARYNVTPNERLFSENITFGENQVGKLWWDLSAVRYVYYEQPIALDGSETPTENLVYRRDYWGNIFPGSSVDIYEWVKSKVPPAEYTGSGIPRDINSYVQINTSNRFTSETSTSYYFWVLNTTDMPAQINRTVPASSVSRLLQSPKSQNFAFFAPIQQTEINNSYIFYNVMETLAYKGDRIQVQYRLGERNDQEHTQWQFFREGDRTSLVSDQYWNKMVDSLCGYTKVLPLSDEYHNSIIVVDDIPWAWDISPWDVSQWDIFADPETLGEYYGEILPVPDPVLSEDEKYGIQYRPRQGMFIKLYQARKVFVQSANALLQYIPVRDDNPSWDTGVLSNTYWEYTNWYKPGYEGVLPTNVFMTLVEADAELLAGNLMPGDIVQVTEGTVDGRFVLYAVIQPNLQLPTLVFEEVGVEDSAIKLLDTLYTTQNVYGLSAELRQLLDAFRTQVFVDEDLVDQNLLFGAMINYVLSEQKNPDWVFKSSYIYIKENSLPLLQSKIYIPDQTNNIIKYIEDVKPYHTKIRDYTSSYNVFDNAFGTAFDSYVGKFILSFGPQNVVETNYDNYINANFGFDFQQGNYILPWDNDHVVNPNMTMHNSEWDNPYLLQSGNNAVPENVIDQFVSANPVETTYVPPFGDPWPSDITIDITTFDPGKIGLSNLYPYTFSYSELTINDPQTVVVPTNIIAVQISDTEYLIYGQDYYVEYNEDNTFTIYFYENPSSYSMLKALIWLDGGHLQYIAFNTYRNELAVGTGIANLVLNTDTKLPVNDVSGIVGPAWAPADYAPLCGWGDIWDATLDPVLVEILTIDNNGISEIPWDVPLVPVVLPNTISYKENTNTENESMFFRNANDYSGILVNDIPAPSTTNENIDIIVVSASSDIFPLPSIFPGVIWVDGERIEYKSKTLVGVNTWELGLVRRGTKGTAPTEHLSMVPEVDETTTGPDGETILKNPIVLTPNKVWVEVNNSMPGNANIDMWNSSTQEADLSSEITFQTWQASPVVTEDDYSLIAYQPNERVVYLGQDYYAKQIIHYFENQTFDSSLWELITEPEYTSVTSVPLGGLWYAQTVQANYLKDRQGKSIP